MWGSGTSLPTAPVLYGEMLEIAYSVIKSAQASDMVLLGELEFTGDCVFHPANYLQVLNDLDLWYAFDVVSVSLPELGSAPENATVDSCGIVPIQLSGIPGADSLRAAADFIEITGDKPRWVHGLRFSNEMLTSEAAARGTLPEVTASDYLARASGLYLSFGSADRIFWSFDPLNNTPGLIAMQTYANLSHTLGGRYEGSRPCS